MKVANRKHHPGALWIQSARIPGYGALLSGNLAELVNHPIGFSADSLCEHGLG